jgi:hypothetical protein
MEENLSDDMKWYKACLRISGETLQPEEVSRELGLVATSSGLKGEFLSSSRLKRPLRSSVWILESPLDKQILLEDHLKWLLDALEPKSEIISRIAKQCEADFFCGFSSNNGQGGCAFSVALLERLAKLGVPLVLDLYPPGPIVLDSNQG